MKHVLLLHGAIGAKDQLQPLSNVLSENYKVHLFNFSGHGGKEMKQEFSIRAFADEVLEWLTENQIDRISIFGYSMGGYVAMYLAANFPDVVEKIMTLGTKYQWDEDIAAKEVKMLNADVIELKVPKFAAELHQRHDPGNWKEVLTKTADMLLAMGKQPPLQAEDFAKIKAPVLLLLGDRDKMVTLAETVVVYQQISVAQLGVLPDTSHPIEAVDVESLQLFITKFLL